MRFFLFTFFVIYGGMHLYAYLKARAALAFGSSGAIMLALFMLVMVAAPVIVRYSERFGLELFARIMAHIGFVWGAILFLFFSSSVVIDLYTLLLYGGGFVTGKDLSRMMPSALSSFLLPLVISVLVCFYGYFEARDIRTERIMVKTPKLPAFMQRLKIVQISDVHLGLMVREGRLKLILDKVRAEDPDILVSTGDLVDGQVCRLNGLEDLFKGVTPRYGKFAVTGNHEFYAGLENTRCFIEGAGFTLLRGESVTVADSITLAGVDDPAGKIYGTGKEISERDLLSALPRERFTLFLKHRPLVDKDAVGLFDMQLSGHIHGGQIFPFSIITGLMYPVNSGRLGLSGGSFLYVSRGSGTWGPPIRFLSPPEVTAIELVRQ